MPQQTGPGPRTHRSRDQSRSNGLFVQLRINRRPAFENPRTNGENDEVGGKTANNLGGIHSAWREPVQPGDARSRGRSRRHGFPHHRCPRGAVLRRAGRRSRGAHPHRPGRPHRRPRRGADLRELGPEVDVLDPARRRTLVALAPHPVARATPASPQESTSSRCAPSRPPVPSAPSSARRSRSTSATRRRPSPARRRPRPCSTPSTAITFGSTASGSSYRCKVDKGSYRTCTSPYVVGGMGEGRHRLSVAGDRQRGQRRPHAGGANARRRPGRGRGHPVQRRLRDRQPVPLDRHEGWHRHRRCADRCGEHGHLRRSVHHHVRRRIPRRTRAPRSPPPSPT